MWRFALLLVISVSLPAAAASTPQVPAGFVLEQIASVPAARELAIAPNGDLFVGTEGDSVYIVPHADGAGGTGAAHPFWTHPDSDAGGDAPNAGVALSAQEHALFVGSNGGVWEIPYRVGQQSAVSARRIASVRTGSIAPNSDGDVHRTTSVAVTGATLYVSVGSSCNSCAEVDPTRAAILELPAGGAYRVIARRIRNAIALAVNPQSGVLWAGVAGQDDLPVGQPYEIFDAVTLHHGVADYGWPVCYDNRRHNVKVPGDCSHAAVPRVIMPAYETPIGAVFYPSHQDGRYAFPPRYRGGAFVTLHGSWHGPAQGLTGYMPPRVVFVAMHGDTPATPPNWSNPYMQWTTFVSSYQNGGTDQRIGRPTGIAVGPQGSLFIADDLTGAIYRIRPR